MVRDAGRDQRGEAELGAVLPVAELDDDGREGALSAAETVEARVLVRVRDARELQVAHRLCDDCPNGVLNVEVVQLALAQGLPQRVDRLGRQTAEGGGGVFGRQHGFGDDVDHPLRTMRTELGGDALHCHAVLDKRKVASQCVLQDGVPRPTVCKDELDRVGGAEVRVQIRDDGLADGDELAVLQDVEELRGVPLGHGIRVVAHELLYPVAPEVCAESVAATLHVLPEPLSAMPRGVVSFRRRSLSSRTA